MSELVDPKNISEFLDPEIPHQIEAIKYFFNNIDSVWDEIPNEVKEKFTEIWRQTDWTPDRTESSAPPRLTREDFQEVAPTIGLWPATLRAFADVESNGGGFNPDGSLKMLFEGQWFFGLLRRAGIDPKPLQQKYPTIVYPVWRKDFYLGGIREYQRLEVALSINPELALQSASWGMFQLLGVNYDVVNYKNVFDMVEDHNKSERVHLERIAIFMERRGVARALINNNVKEAVRIYNGPGQVERYSKLFLDRFNYWYNLWGKD